MISSANIIKKIRIVIIALFIAAAVFAIDTSESHAVSPWHEVTLTPGQTYDVSDAGWNTTVYINKAGNYTLKGESTKCRIVIQSGGVNVYLADGLVIDPGIKSYVGSRTAAITVNDMDGTVKLISKPGADVYFGGYLTAPAVRKYGYNSKLVFETENPADPGTITAYRAHQSSSAGIGSAYEFSGRVDTGNIEINSGNIVATGGYMSAGIGGGGNGNAYKITVNGGNVRATGGSSGTGIGGGFHGNVSNIVINGGTVYAEGVEGAGIGSGEQSGYAKNVIVNGGNVTAKADRGAGIGGGQRSEVENLKITGGTVYAYSRNTAIGSTCDQHLGNLNSLYITGGNITAESDHTAIGASSAAPGPNNIYISGGRINATADYYAIGGGGFSSVTDGDRITNVTISGGTIRAAGGKEDIGTNHTWMDEFNITITGGSLLAERAQMYSAPKNQFGDTVKRTNVTLDGISGSVNVTGASMTKHSSTYPDYGLNDVWTTNGILHFWIPDETEVSRVDTAESTYRGTAVSGQNGTLYPDTIVKLLSDDSDLAHGTGTVYNGSDKIDIISAPEISRGHVAAGYLIDGTDVMIADAEGNLKKNVSVDGKVYTDADGKWTRNASGMINFKAVTEESSYTIAFDANVPEGTKSEPYPDGDMDGRTVKYTEKYTVPAADFSLKGYDFTGWNTKPDGSGQEYTAGEQASSIVTAGTATLYAQWTPKGYSVTFDPNGGSGTMAAQSMVYDVPEALDANQFTAPEGMRFAGWMRTEVMGGTLRADQSVVVNLCNCSDELNEVEGYTLAAQWVSEDMLIVVITLDGTSVSGAEVELRSETDIIRLAELQGNKGTYSAGSAAIAEGSYDIYVDDVDTGADMKVAAGEQDANFTALEYYSVTVTGDDKIAQITGNKDAVLAGSEVEISATAAEGYKFREWTAIECQPEYVDDTSSYSASAVIKVDEKTTLKAAAGPVEYTVEFDGNKPAEASGEISGSMEAQGFEYDREQKLYKNEYALTGYTFTGWNTKADGSGKAYSDREAVKNLTSEDKGTVKMYAQWEAVSYNVIFHENGAKKGQTDDMICSYDKEYAVPECGYEKEDYHFLGWCSEIDGIGIYYYPGDKVKNLASEQGSTVVLYAVWEHDGYTVRYDANGGEGQSAEIYVWIDETYILSNPGFSREGYLMTGWNTAPNGTGKAYAADEKVTNLTRKNGTVTLYAQWTQETYKVTFDANGGKGTMEPQKMKYDEAEKLDPNIFTAPAGKEFAGWMADDGNDQTEDVIYEDQAEVMNLCQYNEEGQLTGFVMVAQWKDTEKEPSDPAAGSHDGTKTGDDFNVLAVVIILIASLTALVAVLFGKRKKSA